MLLNHILMVWLICINHVSSIVSCSTKYCFCNCEPSGLYAASFRNDLKLVVLTQPAESALSEKPQRQCIANGSRPLRSARARRNALAYRKVIYYWNGLLPVTLQGYMEAEKVLSLLSSLSRSLRFTWPSCTSVKRPFTFQIFPDNQKFIINIWYDRSKSYDVHWNVRSKGIIRSTE